MIELLTLDTAADQCAISRRTLERAIREGRLRVIRIGRSVRVRPADLEAYVRSCERRGAA